jgi:hypothetical protein
MRQQLDGFVISPRIHSSSFLDDFLMRPIHKLQGQNLAGLPHVDVLIALVRSADGGHEKPAGLEYLRVDTVRTTSLIPEARRSRYRKDGEYRIGVEFWLRPLC